MVMLSIKVNKIDQIKVDMPTHFTLLKLPEMFNILKITGSNYPKENLFLFYMIKKTNALF